MQGDRSATADAYDVKLLLRVPQSGNNTAFAVNDRQHVIDPLPEFDGFRPALGAWIVGDESAGLGIRETTGLVTDDGAAFVPHRIPEG